MDKNIYEKPASSLEVEIEPDRGNRDAMRNRRTRYVLLALPVVPFCSALFYNLTLVVYHWLSSLVRDGDYSFHAGAFILLFALTFGLSFLFVLGFGLPLNLLLEKLGKMEFKYYFFVGILGPMPFTLSGENLYWFTVINASASATLCMILFWALTVFLPDKTARDRAGRS